METNDLTHLVIGSAYKVHSVLRFGFLEKCYENALVIELKKHGLNPLQQAELFKSKESFVSTNLRDQ